MGLPTIQPPFFFMKEVRRPKTAKVIVTENTVLVTLEGKCILRVTEVQDEVQFEYHLSRRQKLAMDDADWDINSSEEQRQWWKRMLGI